MSCVGLLEFLLGTPCASWICMLISFTRLGKFSVIIFSNRFSISCSCYPTKKKGGRKEGLVAFCHKSQTREAGANTKGKRFYLDAAPSWRMEDSPSQSSRPLQNPDKTQPPSARPEQKDSAQSSRCILKHCPLQPEAAAKCHPDSFACSQLLFGFRPLTWRLCVETAQP